MYARYGDFMTQSSTAEGLWFENGTLQSEKVKMLSRSYAKVQFYIYILKIYDGCTLYFSVSCKMFAVGNWAY